MPNKITGVILAGGKATRFSNTNKALLKVSHKRIIDIQLEIFSNLFDEIIIVTDRCLDFIEHDALIVSDIFKDMGPLGGIYTALHHMKNASCFVTACDMPYINEGLIRHMIDTSGREWIYTVESEQSKRGFEPMHTIFSKKCMKSIKKMLDNDELKVAPLFDELRAKVLPKKEVIMFDSEQVSFKNINSKEELESING